MKHSASAVTGPITEMINVAKHKGFNLIELVIVIVIAGILAVVIAPVVMKPFQAYDDTSRRVVLVDAAESAIRQISSDVRDAIPNTLRTNGSVLEVMPMQGGGRYRYSDVASDNTALSPGATDSQFQMLGNLNAMPTGARLVVYNTGATLFYAAATSGGSGIITPTSTTISLTDNGNEDSITLSSGFRFDLLGTGSPQKRFFIATSPVTYHCDLASGDIRRYENYSTAVAQPVSRGSAPLSAASSNAILVSNVSGCNFNYIQGTNSRAGLLTMNITLEIDGESITVLHQVHVRNAP